MERTGKTVLGSSFSVKADVTALVFKWNVMVVLVVRGFQMAAQTNTLC